MNDLAGAAPTRTPTSLFTRDDESAVPTGLCRGPWTADALHGGPVAALLAHALEAVPSDTPMFPARLTMELFRPVGFDPLLLGTRVVRPGRRVRVLEATLLRDGDGSSRVLARATLQQIEIRRVALPDGLEHVNGPERRPPSPEQVPPQVPVAEPVGFEQLVDDNVAGVPRDLRFHTDAVEHRSAGNLLTTLGRATDWIRLQVPLFAGEPLSRFERVAAAADFGNGISNVLPFDDYVFVNTDLSIHLWRLPVDEWVCVDAVTRIGLEPGSGSVGLAESVLFDRRGRFGRALQTLLVSERTD
jgi:acyl-coenzyme A thioesterase PaaI-like protein